jgi:hypothetical protein
MGSRGGGQIWPVVVPVIRTGYPALAECSWSGATGSPAIDRRSSPSVAYPTRVAPSLGRLTGQCGSDGVRNPPGIAMVSGQQLRLSPVRHGGPRCDFVGVTRNAFEKACVRHGVRLSAYTGGDLDLSTAEGAHYGGMETPRARGESAVKGARVREAQNREARKGRRRPGASGGSGTPGSMPTRTSRSTSCDKRSTR